MNKNNNLPTNEPESADNKAAAALKDVFSLHHDQAHPDKIDAAVRANVRVSGTNMWVLIFAIAIASIGLNVNSTAVVIGAMLISPLMGPIVGMGYGAAVGDVALIRMAWRNIAVFVVISLITATLYFLITPLQQAQSELLARTQPTLWDVLIAFFGGSAGIVAATRKEAGNAVPGVAIATALMPPLCTAGYALAHGKWDYFFGAFYLFSINCVFIAFATLIFVKLLKLPRRGLVTDGKRLLHRVVITAVIAAVMVPSAYLAAGLVRQELFNTTANQVVQELQKQEGFYVLRSTFDHRKQTVGLIINGTGNTEKITALLTRKLNDAGVREPQVRVLYAGGSHSLEQAKAELEKTIRANAERYSQPQNDAEAVLAAGQAVRETDLLAEIRVQFPEATGVFVGRGALWQTENAAEAAASLAAVNTEADEGLTVWLRLSEPLSEKEQSRLRAWLKQRSGNPDVHVFLQYAAEPSGQSHE
ncbi:DUF389 domain-containing protein [Conchiformibius kuhniae]|uniref:DUF389 domain-containing protein n=1 Tax=Conchiformibius kuhniae TaxID=211502 RepID=A0A8T9MRY3_9NEIS|nr:DUF389 domain-containing protein [Conchiformibius kuhniae]UOP04660.1 DUF389 domain-containing protein [Conchiformibius kuhniae]